jgi:hypothetical protein
MLKEVGTSAGEGQGHKGRHSFAGRPVWGSCPQHVLQVHEKPGAGLVKSTN